MLLEGCFGEVGLLEGCRGEVGLLLAGCRGGDGVGLPVCCLDVWLLADREWDGGCDWGMMLLYPDITLADHSSCHG